MSLKYIGLWVGQGKSQIILRSVKNTIELISAVLYAVVWPFIRKGPSRVVLLYHGVKKEHVENFRKQMAYLVRECLVVKPGSIASAHGAGSIVAITFDDAFESLLENGLPILKELGLPVGIFVPAGNLGKRPEWYMDDNCPDKDEIVMNEQQIAALDKEDIEIFSHTLSHPLLTELCDSELEAELVGSKQKLEQIVGHEILGISYPYGNCDDRVYEAVKKAGYKSGFTVDPDIVNETIDNLEIGRFEVLSSESLFRFKLKVRGAYRIVSSIRRLKRRLIRS